MQWNHCPDAVTDRGWLHFGLTEHPDSKSDVWMAYGFNKNLAEDAPTACGNYLFYPGRGYHAVAYVLHVSRVGVSSTHLDIHGGPWYQTREEACEAIQRTVISRTNGDFQLAFV